MTKQKAALLLDVGEALKAVGRIIAGVALLGFKPVFWALRLCLAAELCAATAALLRKFHPWMLPGLALMALGGVFIVWTHRLVKTVPSEAKPLLTRGPFAVVRHPMYSGWSLVAVGAAVVAGFWPATVLAALQCILMLSVSCAEDEENAAVFGAPYLRYSREVWLSGIVVGCVRRALRTARCK